MIRSLLVSPAETRYSKRSFTGRGSRVGAVRQRSQAYNPKTATWTKRGPDSQFMDGKSDDAPFKGVRKEK
jgi:hypothetical protein